MGDIVFDPAGMIYTYGMFISYVTFGLFFWWLLRVKHASDVYIYVMLLILANGFSDTIAMLSRFFKIISGPSIWEQFVDSWVFSMRRVPELVILTVILFRMSMRLRRTLKGIKDGTIIINHQHKDGDRRKNVVND